MCWPKRLLDRADGWCRNLRNPGCLMKLADVFIQPARSITMTTTPGRSVRFVAGQAQIFDQRDMPYMLGLTGGRVIPTLDGMSWAPEWLAHTREIKADVDWPEGYIVNHANQDEWSCVGPGTEVMTGREGAPAEPITLSTSNPISAASLLNVLMGNQGVDPNPPAPEPQPMIPNHKPLCACVKCRALRRKAAA